MEKETPQSKKSSEDIPGAVAFELQEYSKAIEKKAEELLFDGLGDFINQCPDRDQFEILAQYHALQAAACNIKAIGIRMENAYRV